MEDRQWNWSWSFARPGKQPARGHQGLYSLGRQRNPRPKAGKGCTRRNTISWLLLAVGEALSNVEVHRNDEDAEQCRTEHSTNHHRSQSLARNAPGTSGDPERNASEHEGERGHENRAQANPRA